MRAKRKVWTRYTLVEVLKDLLDWPGRKEGFLVETMTSAIGREKADSTAVNLLRTRKWIRNLSTVIQEPTAVYKKRKGKK